MMRKPWRNVRECSNLMSVVKKGTLSQTRWTESLSNSCHYQKSQWWDMLHRCKVLMDLQSVFEDTHVIPSQQTVHPKQAFVRK